MNTLEIRMVDILKELKEKHGAISVRAEFEAEGTKLEELLRLKEISQTAGLKLTLKIGGCESVRDILEARTVGVDYLVAPMVESAYSLRKYLQAVNKIFTPEEIKTIEVLCNIETITACNNLKVMLEIPEIGTLKGIVIERVDLCFSLGQNERCINNQDVNKIVLETIKMAKKKNLLCAIGGGVSADSLTFFKSLSEGYLNYYETRKVCFSCPQGLGVDSGKGILKALEFELLWLKNKSTYYKGIYSADRERMALIQGCYIKELDSLE